MKNLKNGLAIAALFLFTMVSCSEDTHMDNDTNAASADMTRLAKRENFNTEENRIAIVDYSKNLKAIETSIRDIFVPGIKKMKREGVDVQDVKSVIDYYEGCNDCYGGFKKIMVPMLKSLSTAEDKDVLRILDTYERSVDSFGLSYEDAENVRFIIGGMRSGTENTLLDGNGGYQYTTNSFWDCMAKTGGRNIGRGIAYGMITGCVGGGIAGGTVGTVTVPVLGTAVGAVGGCIFGGAAGAVGGAISGAFWSAVDCI